MGREASTIGTSPSSSEPRVGRGSRRVVGTSKNLCDEEVGSCEAGPGKEMKEIEGRCQLGFGSERNESGAERTESESVVVLTRRRRFEGARPQELSRSINLQATREVSTRFSWCIEIYPKRTSAERTCSFSHLTSSRPLPSLFSLLLSLLLRLHTELGDQLLPIPRVRTAKVSSTLRIKLHEMKPTHCSFSSSSSSSMLALLLHV